MLSLKSTLLDAGQLFRGSVLVALILFFNPIETWRPWQMAWKDWAHFPVFFVATYMMLHAARGWIGEHGVAQFRRCLVIVLFALAVGASIELIQPCFGRDRSLQDLLYDAIGALAALCIFSATRAHHDWRRKYGAILCALVLVALSLAKPGDRSWHYYAQYQALPALTHFDKDLSVPQFEAHGNAQASLTAAPDVDPDIPATPWLKLTLSEDTYPGVNLQAFYQDWQGFTSLRIGMFLWDQEVRPITIRIDDERHNQQYRDRFNRTFALNPGWNEILIPLADIRHAPQGREFDLAHVNRVLIFAVSPVRPMTLLIDGLRLTDDSGSFPDTGGHAP